MCVLIALSIGATAPTVAQSSPGGFTLPTSTPTPRPEVEGPADDTGPAALPPRVIPTDRPAPAPTQADPSTVPSSDPTAPAIDLPSPAPTITPVLSPSDTVSPEATGAAGSASDSVTPPNRLPTGQPSAPSNAGGGASGVSSPAVTEAPTGEGTPGFDTNAPLPNPASPDTAVPDTATSDAASAIPLWAWIAGGLTLLALLIGGTLFLRRGTATVTVPEIEQPKVAPRHKPELEPAPSGPALAATTATNTINTPAAPAMTEISEPAKDNAPIPRAPARIDIDIEIVRATRSVMNFTLDYRLNLANRTANAVRDVSVSAILTSAQSGAIPGSSVLGFDRPEPVIIPRIGPNKSHAESGQVQLPTSKLQVMRQGNVPLFVPLLQITITQGNGEPVTRHYVVGQPSTASAARLQPIPLNTPPGGIPGLRVRELDIQPA